MLTYRSLMKWIINYTFNYLLLLFCQLIKAIYIQDKNNVIISREIGNTWIQNSLPNWREYFIREDSMMLESPHHLIAACLWSGQIKFWDSGKKIRNKYLQAADGNRIDPLESNAIAESERILSLIKSPGSHERKNKYKCWPTPS